MESIKKKKVKVEIVKETSDTPLNKGIINKIKDRLFPTKTYLVHMIHSNGTESHFTIKARDNGTFKKGNNTYIVDDNYKTYISTSRMYMLTYHEAFNLPIRISVDCTEMKKQGKAVAPEISTSFNPFLLEDIIVANYAKGVAQSGASFQEAIKTLMILIVLSVAANVVVIAMLLKIMEVF